MNLKKAALIFLAVAIMSTLFACSPQKPAAPNAVTTTSAPQTAEASTAAPESATTTEEQSAAVSEEAPETSEITSLDSGELGDYTVSILSYDLTEDYEGNPAIRVYFEFTNNGDEAASFMFAVSTEAFQNGIELETAIVIGDDVDEDDNSLKDIKPGATITCTHIFVLSDTSAVIVEASELISFSDDMLTKTFDISE